jgi:hypothetical protein
MDGGRRRQKSAGDLEGILCFVQRRRKDGEERRKDLGSKRMTGGSRVSVSGCWRFGK